MPDCGKTNEPHVKSKTRGKKQKKLIRTPAYKPQTDVMEWPPNGNFNHNKTKTYSRIDKTTVCVFRNSNANKTVAKTTQEG